MRGAKIGEEFATLLLERRRGMTRQMRSAGDEILRGHRARGHRERHDDGDESKPLRATARWQLRFGLRDTSRRDVGLEIGFVARGPKLGAALRHAVLGIKIPYELAEHPRRDLGLVFPIMLIARFIGERGGFGLIVVDLVEMSVRETLDRRGIARFVAERLNRLRLRYGA